MRCKLLIWTATVVLTCAAPAIAQVGQKPSIGPFEGGNASQPKRAGDPSGSTGNVANAPRAAPGAQSPVAACQAEISRAKVALGALFGAGASKRVDDEVQGGLHLGCGDQDFLRRNIANNERILRESRDSPEIDKSRLAMAICINRSQLNQCSSTSVSASNQGSSSTAKSSGQPSDSNASQQTEAARLDKAGTDAASALVRAKSAQEAVDKARQGKSKRHVVAREAHACLKPQKGSGVINDCPYAVEYSYCVLKPERNTNAESFECGKNTGSWQIGPGPNARGAMHTAGQATYWFACRYGDSLSKPDGVSAVDIEYQAGRGLLGRCAEWGSGSTR